MTRRAAADAVRRSFRLRRALSTLVQYRSKPKTKRMQRRLNIKQNIWTRHGSGNLVRPTKSSLSAFKDGYHNFTEPCESSLSGFIRKRIVSQLSECVVAVASFVGGSKLFECTGIFIEDLCADATTTSVLTSANICGPPDHVITDNLMIKVRLPNDRVVIGWVHHYDSKCGIAVLNIKRARGFQTAHLNSSSCTQIESNSKALVVGRRFNSGVLKSADGIVMGSGRSELYEFMSSTYEVNMAWIGSPILDFDWNFVGLNLCIGKSSVFLPTNKILECLGVGIIQGGGSAAEASKSQKRARPNSILEYFSEPARREGYPLPNMISLDDLDRMHVSYSFEEEFKWNIWLTLPDRIASTICECVVSLASFNGDVRCFACTGVFIGCYSTRILTSASLIRTGDGNKIDENLQIQVYLRNKQHVVGTLKYYDLRYNIAVVDIVGFCVPRAMDLKKRISFAPNIDVLAVGCLFKQRKLMAANGMLIDSRSKFDCEELRVSSCKITKAGIGGPLIDDFGNFVGMNFFDDEETPYLPREKIQELLENADTKGHGAAEALDNCGSNSWPVPKPVWYCRPWFDFENDLLAFGMDPFAKDML